MSDIFELYKKGVDHLLEEMGEGHPDYSDAQTQRQRLIENIEVKEQYGDNPTLKSERNEILHNLDKIASRARGKSFHEFYESKGQPSLHKVSSNESTADGLISSQNPKQIKHTPHIPERIGRILPVTLTSKTDYRSTIAEIEREIDKAPPHVLTVDYINPLVIRTISDVIVWLRSPAANEEQFIIAKEAVLTYLRNARAKFSVASQEYTKRGLTEKFLNLVEEGRLFLEAALDAW